MKKLFWIILIFMSCKHPICETYRVYDVQGVKGTEYGKGFFLMRFRLDSIETPQSKWVYAGTSDWGLISKITKVKEICVVGDVIESAQ